MGRKSAKAQEDEEQLKAREGGEFSLNSFRLPLQAEDVKSSSNLPGLQVFFLHVTRRQQLMLSFWRLVF